MTRAPLPRGERVHLRHPSSADRDAFLAAVARSRRLHGPWVRAPDTPEAFDGYVRRARRADQACFLIRRNEDEELVGVANLSELVAGAFRSSFLGYYAFTPHARKGYLRDGIGLVVDHGFQQLGLHRIQASVRPENAASTELLRACGFRLEGAAPRYLHLDGDWRDHQVWVRLADGAPEEEVLASSGAVTLHRVTSANWREVIAVQARRDQRRFVTDVTRYLALCRYGGTWSPLAIRAEGVTVGFVMWGRDPDDGSYWIGGFVIDRRRQHRGYGRAALEALISLLSAKPGCRQIALSYEPDNDVAIALYASMGFVHRGEIEDDELVARLDLRGRRRT